MAHASAAQRKADPAFLPSFPYVDLFRAAPVERIEFIKAGVSARKVKILITELHLDQNVMFDALSLKTATVNRKAARDEVLSVEESERVVGLAKLVGQLEAMVEESGAGEDFDAPTWLSRWLRGPLPALKAARAARMLAEGSYLWNAGIFLLRSAASSRSSRSKPPRSWVRSARRCPLAIARQAG